MGGDVVTANGLYLQRDAQTNSVIAIPSDKIEDKIKDIDSILDIKLGTEQKERIREGKAVELESGGEIFTVGMELKDPDRFRLLKGDIKEWERQKAIAYDIEHPEYLGLVKTDENRWEYQQIVNSERFPEYLRSKPKMAQNSSMRR